MPGRFAQGYPYPYAHIHSRAGCHSHSVPGSQPESDAYPKLPTDPHSRSNINGGSRTHTD